MLERKCWSRQRDKDTKRWASYQTLMNKVEGRRRKGRKVQEPEWWGKAMGKLLGK